jgi:Holliday junction resolvase RusA-like endonuclease
MADKKKIVRLFITPRTHVRSTQKDRLCFQIPEETLINEYPNLYKRKLQIERYNVYKKELRMEADRIGFELPTDGAWIRFYIPMPRKWSKKKKAKMAFEPHKTRPDASNLHKAFEDSLKKQDMTIWDYRVSKFWYDSIKGYIEVELPDDGLDMKAVVAMQTKSLQDPVIQ